MRLGIALPLADLAGGPAGPRSYAASAAVAEELGFESLWTFDAVGRGFMLPDPLMALAVAAGATERIDLATGILQLPIRNVVEVAHRVFTLEHLAPGRVLLGVGPGSTAADFATFGAEYRERFDRFDRQWSELRDWIATGRRGEIDLTPPPTVLGGPSLMLAGWRGPWVERAAREAAGWIASAANADDDTLIDALGRYRAAGGGRAVVTNVQAHGDLGPAIERAIRLAEIGFDDVVVFDLRPTHERLQRIREAIPR